MTEYLGSGSILWLGNERTAAILGSPRGHFASGAFRIWGSSLITLLKRSLIGTFLECPQLNRECGMQSLACRVVVVVG